MIFLALNEKILCFYIDENEFKFELKNYSMDFHKNWWEYFLNYPKYLCQFLAKSIENFCFYLNLNLIFLEF